MKMERISHDLHSGHCDRCNTQIDRWRGQGGDLECPGCGAFYNIFGQRLRDDLHTRPNPSEWDENIGDMEGYEIAMSAADLVGEHQGRGYSDDEPGGLDWI